MAERPRTMGVTWIGKDRPDRFDPSIDQWIRPFEDDVAALASVTSLGRCPSCAGEMEYAVAVDQGGAHVSRWCPSCDAL